MIRAWYQFLRRRLMAVQARQNSEERAQRRLAEHLAELTDEARRKAVVE